MDPWLCVVCVGEYLKKKNEESDGDGFHLSAEELHDNCYVAITLVPAWQQLNLGGNNVVMGCVAVPTCPVHLANQTPQQSGRSESGLFVAGG